MEGQTTAENGVIAALWGDDAQGEELAAHLSALSACMVSAAGNLDELDHLVSRNRVECVLCSDAGLDEGLPLLGSVVDRVSGRVPVIFVAPEKRQDAVIQAFRLGARDCVTMTESCADDLVEAIQRLRPAFDRRPFPKVRAHDGASPPGEFVRHLLSPEKLIRKLDEMLAGAGGEIGILAIQIMDLGFFAAKFGRRTVAELSREFARRLALALQGTGYFCRRPDGSFVALLHPVRGAAAFEMAIGQISNQLSFAARLSDLDFRIESVIGACDSSIAHEALLAIESADKSLEKAMARGVRYHIADSDTYGVPLQHSSARGRGRRANRRGGERARVNKRGKLVLPHLNATIDCIVLDVSTTGARLRINSSLVAPYEFELMLPHQAHRRRVKVRWRRQKELGVEFTDQPA
jgi:GGDEF domain-containing protein